MRKAAEAYAADDLAVASSLWHEQLRESHSYDCDALLGLFALDPDPEYRIRSRKSCYIVCSCIMV